MPKREFEYREPIFPQWIRSTTHRDLAAALRGAALLGGYPLPPSAVSSSAILCTSALVAVPGMLLLVADHCGVEVAEESSS